MISILVFVLISMFNLNSVEAIYSKDIDRLVYTCLRFREPEVCKQSFFLIESLQRKAFIQKRYECQTYAIGLASDVLMSKEKINRFRMGNKTLLKVRELCGNL